MAHSLRPPNHSQSPNTSSRDTGVVAAPRRPGGSNMGCRSGEDGEEFGGGDAPHPTAHGLGSPGASLTCLARNREAKHRREHPAKKVWSKENITLHAPKSAYAQVYEGEELKRQLERRARILASAVDSHQMHEDAKRADPKWDEHLSARAERDGGEL